MKYPDRTAHGDAGEFFFAYQIASVLRWPCRLFDIDIGIDAQVEILDEKAISTGKFVAFQIKTTNMENHGAFAYARKRQLSYWRGLDVPVFVVLVDLPKQVMYLHRIMPSKDYPTTSKDLVRIDFDTLNDRFTKSSGATIKAAAEEAALADIREYLTPVRQGIQRIRTELEKSETCPEPEVLIEIMMGRTALITELERAKAVARTFRAGETFCVEAEEKLEESLSELRQFMKDRDMQNDWDDTKYRAGEIGKFIEEGR